MLITQEGATAFFRLSSLAREMDLIDQAAWDERLAWLTSLFPGGLGDDHSSLILSPSLLPPDPAITAEADRTTTPDNQPENMGRQGLLSDSATCFPAQRLSTPWLYWHGSGSLAHWYFHLADRDPWPSIPHGHWRQQAAPKLDPYTGWIYDQHGRQQRRLKRSETAQLWNEKKFRHYSHRAIAWYLCEYPNHQWRVTRPLRLPKAT